MNPSLLKDVFIIGVVSVLEKVSYTRATPLVLFTYYRFNVSLYIKEVKICFYIKH